MAIETPKRGILEFQQDILKQAGGISASNLYQFDIQMSPKMKKWNLFQKFLPINFENSFF